MPVLRRSDEGSVPLMSFRYSTMSAAASCALSSSSTCTQQPTSRLGLLQRTAWPLALLVWAIVGSQCCSGSLSAAPWSVQRAPGQ